MQVEQALQVETAEMHIKIEDQKQLHKKEIIEVSILRQCSLYDYALSTLQYMLIVTILVLTLCIYLG